MFKWCKVKSWLQVLQYQGCIHYYSTMYLHWHWKLYREKDTGVAMLSVGIHTNWAKHVALCSGLFMTYGQETANFVSESPKGLHSLQFLDMPFKTNRTDEQRHEVYLQNKDVKMTIHWFLYLSWIKTSNHNSVLPPLT